MKEEWQKRLTFWPLRFGTTFVLGQKDFTKPALKSTEQMSLSGNMMSRTASDKTIDWHRYKLVKERDSLADYTFGVQRFPYVFYKNLSNFISKILEDNALFLQVSQKNLEETVVAVKTYRYSWANERKCKSIM